VQNRTERAALPRDALSLGGASRILVSASEHTQQDRDEATAQIEHQQGPHQVLLSHGVTREDEICQRVMPGAFGWRQPTVGAQDRILARGLSFPVLMPHTVVDSGRRLVECWSDCDEAIELEMAEDDSCREGCTESQSSNVTDKNPRGKTIEV